MDMAEKIAGKLNESISCKKEFLDQIDNIHEAARLIITAIVDGGKVLICGNGGSAADSQHIAAELTGRFKEDRKALPAIALTTDTSALTAISNDYGYEHVFSRQIEALGKEGDVLIALSTSGNSQNIVKACQKAEKQNMKIVCLSGNDGGKIKDFCNVCIIGKGATSDRIQECHQVAYHILCELIEQECTK